jgi:hypothetical protein
MDVCVCVYSVFCVVLCVGSVPATEWSLIQRVLLCKKILRNWRRGQGPTKGCSAIDELMNEMSLFSQNTSERAPQKQAHSWLLRLHHSLPTGTHTAGMRTNILSKLLLIRWIWGSHKSDYREFYILVHIALCLLPFSFWFLIQLTLRPWRWRRYMFPKRRLTFSGLQGVISQKTEL